MQIVLMRHGKPAISHRGWVNAAGFAEWVAEYAHAQIDVSACLPPASACMLAGQSDLIVCSSLPRSLASARALGVRQIDVCEPLFREVEMPFPLWCGLRLPVSVWSILFRLAWFAGYHRGAESFSAARQRACDAAQQLIRLAEGRERVLLIGHALFNQLVARQLRSAGWTGPRKTARGYWGFNGYRLQIDA